MREQVRKKLQVPSLVGLTSRNAQRMLELMGFARPEIYFEESYEAPHRVIEQSPSKGQVVDADTVIVLRVSQRSLCDYLPALYRSSVFEGHTFLRDYLWIFRHMIDDINFVVSDIHKLFRPFDTPPDFLPWLASWVGFVLDENWSIEKKRLLLHQAVDYYRIRGTVKGLKLYLSVFVDVEPEIIENSWPFNGFQIDVHSRMDIDSVIFPPVNTSHCFIVDIPLDPSEVDDYTIIRIHDIIRAEKPAHTMYFLRFKGKKVTLSEFRLFIGDSEDAYVVGSGEEIVEIGDVEVERLTGE